MQECQEKVSQASAFLLSVNSFSAASAFQHQGQSGAQLWQNQMALLLHGVQQKHWKSVKIFSCFFSHKQTDEQ
jgi:hypothetical protein